MNWKKYKPYLYSIVISEGVGFLASFLSREGTKRFNLYVNKPPLTPPALVFPIAWGTLYALMGISSARIWLSPMSGKRSWGLNLYITQLVLNFFWTLIFFNAAAYGAAAIWILILWLAVLAMVWQFFGVDKTAAWLQVPYLAWLTFAAYLNFGVWMLNK